MTPVSKTTEFSRATHLISTLNLKYLPKESGYIGLLGRSTQAVTTCCPSLHLHPSPTDPPTEPRTLSAQSHNYYMLTSALPINYLHRLAPDDTHILVKGGPVDYYIFHPSTPSSGPRAERVTLGTDLAAGHLPVISIPGGCWKALKLHKGVELALMVNVLSPEFTDDQVRIGEGEDWVRMFEGRADWATREGLRGLIGGENWEGRVE